VSPREPRIAPTLLIHEVAPEQCIYAFHTIKVATLNDPALPDSFRSHYEEGLEPRYRQAQHAATHMAVSFWRDEETCRVLAKRFPKHGTHIARVCLTFGHGFDYLDPSLETDPQHLTVWGDPARLASAVVDIVPVHT
jgi:hypothetical protein